MPRDKETYVSKTDLPTQTEICKKIGIKSPKTYRTHLKYLIDQGYIIDNETEYYLPKKEDIYLLIPLETLQFLLDTLNEQVIKIYVYLGQRYKFKPNYTFTLKEIAQHIGLKIEHNPRAYEIINNCLTCLKNNGLIDYAEFYQEKTPYKRLTSFSFTHKKGKI